MKPIGNDNYQHGSAAYDGVLLVNLGTPSAPTPRAVRRWLKEFLSDPRVVEMPRPIWWLILHLFILPFRPLRLAKLYQSIWHGDYESQADIGRLPSPGTPDMQGSPLLVYSQKKTAALQQRLNAQPNLLVKLAMSYGEPSIRSALSAMQKYPVRRLLVLPLYPQYSSTTTACVFDAVSSELQQWRWLPEVRFIHNYHDDQRYIHACAQRVLHARAAWGKDNAAGNRKLLFSFHGLPRANLLKGDPYHCQCHATARRIAERLKLSDEQWQLSFQSRFGRSEWLRPYTDETLQRMAQRGVQAVDVFCPGFAVDCLETLEEIKIQSRKVFLNAGGQSYHYIPALNDSAEHVDCLLALIQKHSSGWDHFGCDPKTEEQRAALKQRAMDAGADK